MNISTLTGNLVDDPQKVEYGDKQVLVNFRIGNNEQVGGESVLNGFFDVTAFGATAVNVLASLKKGDQAIVIGRWNQTTFDREDGTKGSRTKLVAQIVGVPLTFGPVTPVRKAKAVEAPVTE